MDKIDFKKTIASYKAEHNVIGIIEVSKMQYLMIDGHGDPNTSRDFAESIPIAL